MKRHALVVGIGLWLLPLMGTGVTINVEAMTVALQGQEKDEVCAKALVDVRQKGASALLELAYDTREYHQLLDAIRWQGGNRDELKALLKESLETDLLFSETRLWWSGRSCLLKGYVEADLPLLLRQEKAAVDAKIGRAKPAAQPERTDGWVNRFFKGQANLAEALAELTTIKLVVTEFWMGEGRWPRSLSEAGLHAADLDTSESLERVVIGQGGVIQAWLKGTLAGERIHLVPVPSGLGMRWRCETSVDTANNNMCVSMSQ